MTERLRIAVLSRNFATTGGGAERYSIAVVEELAPRHEVHVFAQTITHDFPGVIYHRVAMPLQRPRWINQLYFAWATWRATRTGFDIVHSHENTWHGNVQTVHVLPIKHNLVADKHGAEKLLRWVKVVTSPRLLAYLWLEKARYNMQGKRRVVLTSSSLQETMQRTYPNAAPVMEVITPGVASAPGLASTQTQRDARVRLGLPQVGKGLLFVGNDFHKKGLPTLLHALAVLPEDVFLTVVGTSASLAEMRQLAMAAGVAQRVFFLGGLPDVDDAYIAADCLVHPTQEDTYAMVVLEAMSHGLPVVVSGDKYCGIARDLVQGQQALLLETPNSVAELVAAITSIVNNPEIAHRLSQAGTAYARGHSWAQVAARYEQVFANITRKYTQRWLVLSHCFNMDGRAASQTITDKLPHLDKAGIELVVLSGVSGVKDAQFEHYQLWPAGAAGIRFELRHVLRKHLTSPIAYRAVMLIATLGLFPFMLVEKLLRPIESSWSWWLSAYLKGVLLARKNKFDLIYSTGGAFAAHVAGRALKRTLKTPWLAEVHDPLVIPETHVTTAQEKTQLQVEEIIGAEADVAIWFTEQALQSARSRQPALGARGKTLLPGIDAPFGALPPYLPGLKFVIGHFGSLSSTRNLGPLVDALEKLLRRRSDILEKMEVHVYGGPLDAVSSALIAQSPVGACVRHFGRIEADPKSGLSGRWKILQLMRSVDVLLLLHGNESICAEYIPSKLYEYLWMQRPIVAIVHCNPQMSALLRSQKHVAIDTNKGADCHAVGDDLEREVERLFDAWNAGGLADNGQRSPYTTEAAVEKLMGWVDAIAKEPR